MWRLVVAVVAVGEAYSASGATNELGSLANAAKAKRVITADLDIN